MTRTRLHTIAPSIDAILAKAEASRRGAAGWAAARWAVDRVGLADAALEEGFSTHDLGTIPSVVEEIDSRYFALQELVDAGHAQHRRDADAAFSCARAASAVEFAARGEAVEAVYEAGVAVDDWASLASVIEAALSEGA